MLKISSFYLKKKIKLKSMKVLIKTSYLILYQNS